ncbi:HTH-type transcriptional repressor BluR [Tepidimonas thermarum]|uniref:HTH-type transcriptional repressor BluR n=1 Tax=Tepidimonas thermarum TaxID=335431 RepID=A0A554X578_9BURK|nr:MerR family transcriptional regulator [Tepidimonas thermarum]TSE30906.1 HTH-type transcriptional repressor BluR [Tepidimonas thermarum]
MSSQDALPPIPPKRYFTIGEVSELCGVKPHVLRYWEQEFTQLRPMKRRGNRRYYQHHEVLMIRRIRELLYDQGFTIHGARNRLAELAQQERARKTGPALADDAPPPALAASVDAAASLVGAAPDADQRRALLAELRAIRALLDTDSAAPAAIGTENRL